jgi:hypothetical protein
VKFVVIGVSGRGEKMPYTSALVDVPCRGTSSDYDLAAECSDLKRAAIALTEKDLRYYLDRYFGGV